MWSSQSCAHFDGEQEKHAYEVRRCRHRHSRCQHPQAEHGFQVSRVILAFANGNNLILTVNLRCRSRCRCWAYAPECFGVGQQPIRMIKSKANWACSSAVRAGTHNSRRSFCGCFHCTATLMLGASATQHSRCVTLSCVVLQQKVVRP